jgi:hypothetical protein
MTAKPKKPRAKPAYPPAKLERARKEWAKQFNHCMICCGTVVEPGNGYATIFKHVHHIAHKSLAPGKFEHPCNWLCVCAVCHDNLHNANQVSSCYAACLAAKAIFDSENFNLVAWHELISGGTIRTIEHYEVQAAADTHYLHKLENIRRILRAKRNET